MGQEMLSGGTRSVWTCLWTFEVLSVP
jgi:hypothetical protein